MLQSAFAKVDETSSVLIKNEVARGTEYQASKSNLIFQKVAKGTEKIGSMVLQRRRQQT